MSDQTGGPGAGGDAVVVLLPDGNQYAIPRQRLEEFRVAGGGAASEASAPAGLAPEAPLGPPLLPPLPPPARPSVIGRPVAQVIGPLPIPEGAGPEAQGGAAAGGPRVVSETPISGPNIVRF